jgi:hypothetical protein
MLYTLVVAALDFGGGYSYFGYLVGGYGKIELVGGGKVFRVAGAGLCTNYIYYYAVGHAIRFGVGALGKRGQIKLAATAFGQVLGYGILQENKR